MFYFFYNFETPIRDTIANIKRITLMNKAK